MEVWENSKLRGNTRQTGSCSHFNFSFSQTSARVSITLWKHGKCFLFLKLLQTNAFICSSKFFQNQKICMSSSKFQYLKNKVIMIWKSCKYQPFRQNNFFWTHLAISFFVLFNMLQVFNVWSNLNRFTFLPCCYCRAKCP